MALMVVGALYGETADKWRVFDDEGQAKTWQDANPGGVTWHADIEIGGGDDPS